MAAAGEVEGSKQFAPVAGQQKMSALAAILPRSEEGPVFDYDGPFQFPRVAGAARALEKQLAGPAN